MQAGPITSQSTAETGLVSCVIIFLNAERYLAEAIESVIAQTYRDWELLLVDDGSTDGGAEIARAYAAAVPGRIRLFRHADGANRGKSVSRNLGLRAARGEFLAMLDADDVWLPAKLEEQVALMRAHPDVGIVTSPVLYWYGWTGRPLDRARDVVSQAGLRPGSAITVYEPPDLIARILLADAWRSETICPYPSCLLLRREVFEACGGFDEDFRDLYDDVVFFAKALLQARALVSNRVWARYRLHPDADVSTSYERAIAAGEWDPHEGSPAERAFLDRVAQHVAASGVRRRRLQYALAFARLRYQAPRLFQALRWVGARKRALAKSVRARIRRGRGFAGVHPGRVRWGDFDRLQPIDDRQGFSRGLAIRDRLIAEFLRRHATCIRGRVAEIGDDVLARRHALGDLDDVEILSHEAVLAEADRKLLGEPHCDCLIVVDAAAYAKDPRRFAEAVHAQLKPGGIALAALPGCSAREAPGQRWSFTAESAREIFAQAFPDGEVEVHTYGNVRLALASLHGLGGADLDANAWAHNDPAYPVLITVAARRR